MNRDRVVDLQARREARTLNLSVVPPALHEQARKAFEARDALGFVFSVANTHALGLVFDNFHPLRAAGMYEAALLEALIGTRTNHRRWSLDVLRGLLALANPHRLRAAGDPLPGPGPFTLYRGVHGRGPARKVRGLHWTSSPCTAAWFATRWPGVHDPAVFVVTVPESAVRAYVTDRGEDDYVVDLPRRIQPERLPALPDPRPPRRAE